MQKNKNRNETGRKSLKINWRKESLKLLGVAIVMFFMTSCKTTAYYQVYKVNPVDDLSKNLNSLVFEDENCKVVYNFWEEGGNAGFKIYNKTDENIYINMKESFFIKNDMAFDYFQNRVFTNSKSYSLSVSNGIMAMNSYTGMNAIGLGSSKSVSGNNFQGLKQTNTFAASLVAAIAITSGIASTNTKKETSSSGFSTAYKEKNVICVPSKTAKIISEFNITNSLYRDCDLLRYPSKNQIRTLKFSSSKSPITFSNRIVYTVGNAENSSMLENKFYVSEITNYPKDRVIINKAETYCGEKSKTKSDYFNNASPNSFYIKYNKGTNEFKH